jgi:MFS family permease
MFGAGFAGWVQDRFGRRISLGLGAVIALLGIVIIYLSSSYPTADGKRAIFLLGKVFEGFAIGQTAATTQTYISEIAPNSLLGPVSAFFPAVILTGQLIGARIVFGEIYVVADWGYKTCMLSMFPFAGAVVLISFIMPESPTWLVRMGRATAARAAIKRLERAEHDIEDVIYDLVVVMGKEKKECGNGNVSIMQCFKGADARRTRIIILANTMTNMFGVTFLNTATYFYEMLGMEPGIAITMLELGIGVGILSNFISVWTMTKFSRRPLMIGTFTIISILWFAIGVTGFFPISKEIN